MSGATTMVTETYRRSEKGKIEGLHDFLLFGTSPSPRSCPARR
ncbi:hypothetical protein [Brucella sp. IR073]